MQKRRKMGEATQAGKLDMVDWACLLAIVAFVALSLVGTIVVCSWWLPRWAAIPLGLLVGSCGIYGNFRDNTTLLEMGIISCAGGAFCIGVVLLVNLVSLLEP